MKKIAFFSILTISFLTAENGADLFKRCVVCHGANGEKVYAGKVQPLAGTSKAVLVERIKGYQAGTNNKYGMGSVMKSQTSSLNDEQIDTIATYISNLKK